MYWVRYCRKFWFDFNSKAIYSYFKVSAIKYSPCIMPCNWNYVICTTTSYCTVEILTHMCELCSVPLVIANFLHIYWYANFLALGVCPANICLCFGSTCISIFYFLIMREKLLYCWAGQFMPPHSPVC